MNDKKPDGEQKPEDKKPELGKDGKPIEKKADDGKVPEKYDFKVPEGFKLDEKLSEQASTLFKEMGLSQENAQKLIDLNIQQLKAASEGPAKAYSELTQKWRTDSENHPDLKGKLGEGQEINVRIGRFLNGLNDPQLASDFRALMDMTGAGNHQAFIRVIDAAARKLTEGSHVSGNGPSTGGQSAGNKPAPTAAEAMWPNLANRGQ